MILRFPQFVTLCSLNIAPKAVIYNGVFDAILFDYCEFVAIPHTFDSPEAMISSGLIDATVIINSGTHCDLVVKSLNTELDVFCEKPLAYTREEMELIESALIKSGKKLMIGYMKTFDQAVTRAASLIDSRPRTADGVRITIRWF